MTKEEVEWLLELRRDADEEDAWLRTACTPEEYCAFTVELPAYLEAGGLLH
jgi:hypothetical protein